MNLQDLFKLWVEYTVYLQDYDRKMYENKVSFEDVYPTNPTWEGFLSWGAQYKLQDKENV